METSIILTEGISTVDLPTQIKELSQIKEQGIYYIDNPNVYPYQYSKISLDQKLVEVGMLPSESIFPKSKKFFENDTPQLSIIAESIIEYSQENALFVIPQGKSYQDVYRQMSIQCSETDIDYKEVKILYLSDLISLF